MRKEIKFILTGRQDVLLERMIQEITQKDQNLIDDMYTVQSIYFDTPGNKDFHDGNNGIFKRQKNRIRFYNGHFEKIIWEKKEKKGVWSNKTSFSLDQSECLHLIDKKYEFLKEKGALAFEAYERFRNGFLEPKVFVVYDRAAYVLPYTNVRITFDRNLRCAPVREAQTLMDQPALLVPSEYTRILEVKYDHFLPNVLKSILHTQNLSKMAVSKYNVCRMTLLNRR